MIRKIVQTLWGDLRGNELKKFVLLALGFFFLIGSYWPLKTLKDSIFANIVGPEHLPTAKMLSLALFFPLVLLYSKLIDHVAKEMVIYLLVFTYGTMGFFFVWAFYHPTIGLENTLMSSSRTIGWAFFVFVESYIALMLSLYWSFVNDVTTTESAKSGYGLLVFGSQFGGFMFSLLGSSLTANTALYAKRSPLIILICVSSFFLIAVITFLLKHVVSEKNLESYEERLNRKEPGKPQKKSVGFLDGLKVLVTHPYVAGIFGLIFFQEVTSAVMNYQMIRTAKAIYVDGGVFTKFMFDYALAVQGIACLFGLVGTSFFQRRFGIKFCIIAFPTLLGSFIAFYFLSPSLSAIVCVMLIARAMHYALNQPAKEVLYIPTSRNIKFKSKAWIDMFGMRFSKAAGQIINKLPMTNLVGGIVLSLIGIWIVLAGALGNYFRKTVANKELIE